MKVTSRSAIICNDALPAVKTAPLLSIPQYAVINIRYEVKKFFSPITVLCDEDLLQMIGLDKYERRMQLDKGANLTGFSAMHEGSEQRLSISESN